MIKAIKNNLYMLGFVFKFCPLYFFAVVFMSVLSSMSSIVNILYMKYLINTIVLMDGPQKIILYSAVFLAWSLVVALANLCMQHLITPINTQKLHQKMQIEIFKKTLEIDYANYEDAEFYSKYSMALQQSDARVLAVLNSFSTMIGSFFGITTLVALVTSIEPVILLIVAANVCIGFSVTFIYSKIQHKFYEERIHPQRESGYVQRVYYLREFAQELRLFGSLKKILRNKFDDSINNLETLYKKFGKKSIQLLSGNGIISLIANTAIILYLSFKTLHGKLSIGDFTAGSSSSQQLSNQILQLLNVFPQLYEHNMYIENFKEFMNLSSQISSGDIKLSTDTPITISLRNISFQYSSNTNKILHNINLTIHAGEKVAFVGKNGAGKSTLIKLLARLYEPTNGEIFILNKPISAYDIESYRNAISIVFQNFQTFALSIAENVLMRPIEGKQDEAIVINALKSVGLYEKICTFPDGIYASLSREFTNKGVNLSGGELQKLAIARVYAQNSKVIILDEPTSGLDPFSENELLTRLLDSSNGKTVILISHRLSNIVNVDTIFFFNNGVLTEFGSHGDLMKANGEYAEMFRLQASEYILSEDLTSPT